ncbi:MAG TPA: glycosyltransferase family 39 protein [Povalibacter sp.]|nr:glycosyltransferase family 39 protein [Povalibacter sp.]
MPVTVHSSLLDHLVRPGATDARAIRSDLFWLIGLSLLLIATGIGLRDPWPADEPRFALVARDMVATHQWLIPYVGGDVYADKPPFFFWLIAIGLSLTGSLRLSFLLPSLLAGVGCVILIYDLARRLWTREAGMSAALALLFCVQFVWQARQAQIDATLGFFTTLGLYGLLRHCLLGPDWKWYAIGWAAAGFGIITKGVGFLPLLVLIPYAVARKNWQPRPTFRGGWRWMVGPLALLLAVSVWLVPMLLAAQHNPALQAYRDEILFGQTVGRYTSAWHHREPFWYFLVDVIPALWLPFTALLPWLIPGWRTALRQRDLRILLPLAWLVLVVLFFSLSTGKRGVYVLPAVPALALAAGPLLASIARRPAAQRTIFIITALLSIMLCGAAAYVVMHAARRQEIIDLYSIDAPLPLLLLGGAAALACVIARPRLGFAAWGMSLTAVLLIVSFVIVPQIDGSRSARDFVRRVEAMTAGDPEVGFVGYKEQYLLQLRRPITNFGHARWREAGQETADAAAWMARKPGRVLLVDATAVEQCFRSATVREVGDASRELWYLVSGQANPECVEQGRADAAIQYTPPH